MKNYQRAIRRHHRERLLYKRKNYHTAQRHGGNSPSVVNTPRPCSCALCGNPRKYWKEKTYQEKKNAA
ncbi:MAG: hypothetical protein R3C61_24535 [Bacteroidia bacterium]